jgi:hypothetical protein
VGRIHVDWLGEAETSGRVKGGVSAFPRPQQDLFQRWPQLPDGLPWRKIAPGGITYALNFLGQVDLSEVARVMPDTPLPHEGVLFFFLDTSLIMVGTWTTGPSKRSRCGDD